MTRFIVRLRLLRVRCWKFDLDTANGFIKDYLIKDEGEIQKRLNKVGVREEASDDHDFSR